MSIRNKLIIAFLVTSVIPLFIIGLFVYVDLRSSLERNIFTQLEAIASFHETRVNAVIRNYVINMRKITGSLDLQTNLAAYNSSPNQDSLGAITQVIKNMEQVDPLIESIAVISPNGDTLAATKQSLIGKNVSHIHYFQLGKTKLTIAGIYKDENNVVLLRFVSPVYTNGNIAGVVVVS